MINKYLHSLSNLKKIIFANYLIFENYNYLKKKINKICFIILFEFSQILIVKRNYIKFMNNYNKI